MDAVWGVASAMVAASPRASAVVAIITAPPRPPAQRLRTGGISVSPSTVTPSSEATTGSATVIAGNEAVSVLARKADC